MNSARLIRIGALGMSVLTVLAALPYEQGEMATLIPPDWKPIVLKIGLVSAIILHVVHEVMAVLAEKK